MDGISSRGSPPSQMAIDVRKNRDRGEGGGKSRKVRRPRPASSDAFSTSKTRCLRSARNDTGAAAKPWPAGAICVLLLAGQHEKLGPRSRLATFQNDAESRRYRQGARSASWPTTSWTRKRAVETLASALVEKKKTGTRSVITHQRESKWEIWNQKSGDCDEKTCFSLHSY